MSRFAIQYYEIKNSGHAALLIVAPLEVDSVIVKTLSQKDVPPILPSESWPKIAEEKPSFDIQVMPSLID